MKVLFMEKEGVNLYETLMNSETSRIILRFYEPSQCSLGVAVSPSTLGIALSLVSELRWYVRRYMIEVLFELREGIYGTYTLAREVYERDIRLDEKGIQRFRYGIRNGRIACVVPLQAGIPEDPAALASMDEVMEVWSLEMETFGNDSVEGDLSEDIGENHLSADM
jgi:hypothetical protein